MNKSRSKLTNNTQDRLSKLADTLKNIRVFTENEKNSRISRVEQKVKNLEDQLHDYQDSFSKKLNQIKDTTNSVQRDVEADKREYESIAGNDLEDLNSFEDRLNAAYETLKQKRKEFESRMNSEIEEHVNYLAQEHQKEQKIFQDAFGQLNQVYQSDTKRLESYLIQEIAEREDGDEKITTFLNNDLKKLDDGLFELKNDGENSEKKIFETIKTSVSEIKSILEEERRKRETTHDNMINLLEEATKNFKRIDEIILQNKIKYAEF